MKPTPSSSRADLRVESLEDRCVLSATSYVNALYTDLLHRQPTGNEAAGWINQLSTGALSPSQVANAIVNSTEFRLDLIQSDYQLFLGRQGNTTEVQGWLNQMQTGVSAQQMELAFLNSAEFFQLHGNTGAGWLAGVYQDVLGRAPTSMDNTFWLGQLEVGQSQQAVARQIVNGTESLDREVTTAYDQIFSRAPDTGGLNYWAGQLSQGVSVGQLEAQLAASTEFLDMQGGIAITPTTPTTPTTSPTSPSPTPVMEPTGGPITPQLPDRGPDGPIVR